jgi:hypothetical protein
MPAASSAPPTKSMGGAMLGLLITGIKQQLGPTINPFDKSSP